MKTLLVGIANFALMKERTMKIARGEHRPSKDEPKIWFTSIESFARILSDKNRELLKLIYEHQPDSLTELAEVSGREKSNLSRTLKTMNRYGLVQLKDGPKGSVIPRVPYSNIRLAMNISGSRNAQLN